MRPEGAVIHHVENYTCEASFKGHKLIQSWSIAEVAGRVPLYLVIYEDPTLEINPEWASEISWMFTRQHRLKSTIHEKRTRTKREGLLIFVTLHYYFPHGTRKKSLEKTL